MSRRSSHWGRLVAIPAASAPGKKEPSMMKSIRLILTLAALGSLLTGCGSGPSGTTSVPVGPGADGPGASVPSRSGSVTFNVHWPTPSRLIPVASNSIKFVVNVSPSPLSQALAGIVINRPQTSATLSNLQVGTLYVTATAYPQAGAQGVPQATAQSPIQVTQGATATISISMVSTIDHIDITPATPSLVVGQTTMLVATPRDINGNVVVVAPTNLQFLSDAPNIVSVDNIGPQVTIVAHSVGTANIRVLETESQKTGMIPVVVLPHTFTLIGNLITALTRETATLLQGGALNGFVLVTGGPFGQLLNPMTGAFISTGQTATPRQNQTATLLNDGTVLIAGGNNGTSTLNTAELFVPALTTSTGVFTPVQATLTTPREGQTATLLPNGKVLIAGGSNGGVALASAELFDPGTKAFTATTPMRTPRTNHTATLLADGTVLIVGGANGQAAVAGAELFDSSLNGGMGGFRPTGSLLTARFGHTATLLSTGSVLIAGGSTGMAVLNTAEIYDPPTGTFRPTTNNMSSARIFHTATRLNSNRVLLAGGSNGVGVLNSADIFDPTTGLFSPAPDTLNIGREHHAAALLNDGRVVLIGGDNGAMPLPSAEVTTSIL